MSGVVDAPNVVQPTRPRRGRTAGLIAAVTLILGSLLCCGAFDGWATSDANSESSTGTVVNFHAGRTYLVYTRNSSRQQLHCQFGAEQDLARITVDRSADAPMWGETLQDNAGESYTYFGRFVADRDGFYTVSCDQGVDFDVTSDDPEIRYGLAAIALGGLSGLVGVVFSVIWAVKRSRRAKYDGGAVLTGKRSSWVWYLVLGGVVPVAGLAFLVVLVLYLPLAAGAYQDTQVGTSRASVLVDSGTRYLVYVDAGSAGAQCAVKPAGVRMTVTPDRPIGVPERVINAHKEYVYVGQFRGIENGLPDSGFVDVECPNSVSGVMVRPDSTPLTWVVSTGTAAFVVITAALVLLVRVIARRSRIPAPAKQPFGPPTLGGPPGFGGPPVQQVPPGTQQPNALPPGRGWPPAR